MTTTTLLLLAALAQTKKVTVTTPLAHSSVVLEQFGKAAGVTMKPTGTVLKDYFFVRFKDTPLDVAMDRIAKTLNATWALQEDGSYLLKRSQTQDLQTGKPPLDNSPIKKAVDDIKVEPFDTESFRKTVEEAKKLADSRDPNIWQQIQKVDANSPLDRFAKRLVKMIGAETLSAIKEGETLWFAPNPTRRQAALPQAASSAYQLLVQEVEASRALVPEEPQHGGYYIAVLNPLRIDVHKPVKFGLAVTRYQGGGMNATAYFQQDNTFDQRNVSLQSGGLGTAPDPKGVFAGIKTKFEPGPELQELISAMKKIYSTNGIRDISPEAASAWARVFHDSQGRDFTTVLGSEFFQQSADAKGTDMVALVPDLLSFLPVFAAGSGQSTNEMQQMWSLASQFPGGVNISEADGYVSVRPADYVAGRDRLDRKSLEKLMAGDADLDTLADFVGATESDDTVMVAMIVSTLARPGSANRLGSLQSNPDLLRIYGRLSPQERRQAKNGGYEIPLTNIPPHLVKPIDKMVFGKNMQLTDSYDARDKAEPNVRYGASSIDKFTAFCLGNGLPSGSKLRIIVEDRDRLFMRRSGKYGTNDQATSIDSAAQQIAAQTSPAFENEEYYRENKVVGFCVTNQTELFLEFEFPGAGVNREMLAFPKPMGESSFVEASKLPTKWRDQLVTAIDKMKEMYKDIPAQRGYTPPPLR